jgi:hypothetical protein
MSDETTCNRACEDTNCSGYCDKEQDHYGSHHCSTCDRTW